MNTKAKGSRAERRCIRLLEADGYICTKAGGSLGLFDVVAIGAQDIRCVQVKDGRRVSVQRPSGRRSSHWPYPRT